jgi:branched-subunit amino acid transport protein
MVLLGKIRLAPIVHAALRFVPIAVLTALITPALFLSNNQLRIPWENTRLIAGAIAIVVAWKTKNVLLTIGAGMGSLIIMDIVISRW